MLIFKIFIFSLIERKQLHCNDINVYFLRIYIPDEHFFIIHHRWYYIFIAWCINSCQTMKWRRAFIVFHYRDHYDVEIRPIVQTDMHSTTKELCSLYKMCYSAFVHFYILNQPTPENRLSQTVYRCLTDKKFLVMVTENCSHWKKQPPPLVF